MRISDWSSDVCSSDLKIAQSANAVTGIHDLAGGCSVHRIAGGAGNVYALGVGIEALDNLARSGPRPVDKCRIIGTNRAGGFDRLDRRDRNWRSDSSRRRPGRMKAQDLTDAQMAGVTGLVETT